MTKTATRVPLHTRLLFGSGSIAFGVKDNGFSYFLLIYYNQVLGLPATWAGTALAVALIFDAFSDPLVGYVSDHWHSRWGRRHPFMYGAAVPLAIAYYLLWSPPVGLSQAQLLVYLLVGTVLVRTILTLYEVPSVSMVPELTPDYDERTSLLAFRFFFGWLGGLTMAVLAYSVFLAATPEYPNGVLNPAGYRSWGLMGGVLILASVLTSALGTHSWIPRLKRPPESQMRSFGRVLGELRVTLSNRSFRALFFGGFFFAGGIGVTTALNLYINTYFWEFTSEQIVTIVYWQAPAALLAPMLAPLLTRRFDKKRVALGLATFAILFGAAPVMLRLAEWFPPNGSPWLLPILRAHGFVEVTVFIIVTIALSSMIADVAEENEIETGRREEGIFFAARNFALKATSGVGTFVAGVALDLIAFPEGAEPASVEPDVVFRLGLVFGPLLMTVFFTALLFIRRYSITRDGHARNLAMLAQRS